MFAKHGLHLFPMSYFTDTLVLGPVHVPMHLPSSTLRDTGPGSF